MKNWQPVDIIVLILTMGVFIILIFPIVARLIHPEITITEGGLKVLVQVTIALISIISMYIGFKVNGKGK